MDDIPPDAEGEPVSEAEAAARFVRGEQGLGGVHMPTLLYLQTLTPDERFERHRRIHRLAAAIRAEQAGSSGEPDRNGH